MKILMVLGVLFLLIILGTVVYFIAMKWEKRIMEREQKELIRKYKEKRSSGFIND
ncbi:MAG: hypothetical protein M0R03_16410 [Novosphingobium sp.]|nr:hypothetical protein [Novosphingobium sp.]